MNKQLMHKDDIVAEVSISKNNMNVTNVKVQIPALFPDAGDTPVNSMRRWLINRQTFLNRKDIMPLSRFYGETKYLSDNLCSLNDCYWIRNKDDGTTWANISPYKITDLTNDCIYQSTFYPEDFDEFLPNSPNLTLNTQAPVFWHRRNGVLGLVNFDARSDMNLYKAALEQDTDIIRKREYLILAKCICTFTESATSEKTERIPFNQMYLYTYKPDRSKWDNLKYCCEYYHIPEWEKFIQKIIDFNKQSTSGKIDLFDVGVLRDADELKIIGFDRI